MTRWLDRVGGTEAATLSMLGILAGAGHDVTLYTNAPPASVPRGVSIAVPKNPAPPFPPRPPAPRGFHLYRGGHAGLMGMSDDDVLVVSDWEAFAEPTRARRILWYFHLPPERERAVLRAGPPPLWPGKWPRRAYQRLLVRRRLSGFDLGRTVLVPNSLYTARILRDVFGRAPGPVLYPPARVAEMEARRGRPKRRRAATVAAYWEHKRHGMAMRAAAAAGVEWVSIGAAAGPGCAGRVAALRRAAGPGADIRTDVGRAELVEAVSSSRVYLHAADEAFGIAVVEAVAAGCVPIVHNGAANAETVPFGELRFDTEAEAAAKVRAAADGRYDGYLPRLAGHARRFSEEAFARRLLRMIGDGAGGG